jgi:iron complex transport system substrate-binding protein
VLQNCDVTLTFARPPARVVTLNQAATEVMLVLGLKDRLVGTACLDDQVLPELAEEYRQVPVLASQYPSREALFGARPDLLYAVYPGAFGPAGVGSRADWKNQGVDTYLAPAGCADKSRPPGVTLDTTFAELREVARIFNVAERGHKLVARSRPS